MRTRDFFILANLQWILFSVFYPTMTYVYGNVRILPSIVMPIYIVQYVIYMNSTVLSQISTIFFSLQYIY